MSTEHCQQLVVDVFSDQGRVELLKAMAEGDHGLPNPPKNQIYLGANPECAA